MLYYLVNETDFASFMQLAKVDHLVAKILHYSNRWLEQALALHLAHPATAAPRLLLAPHLHLLLQGSGVTGH